MDKLYTKVEIFAKSDMHMEPFSSIQDTLSLLEPMMDLNGFGAKIDMETLGENEMNLLKKELANSKLLVDVINSDNIEAHFKLEVFYRTIAELSQRLKLSEYEKERHMKESKRAKSLLGKLRSKFKILALQLLELSEDQELPLQVAAEGLNISGDEHNIQEAEFSAVEESENIVSRQISLIDSEFVVDELEHMLVEKTFLSDFFMVELQQQKELNISYVKAASDATAELERLLSDMEVMEGVMSEKEKHIKSMACEIKRLEDEVQTVREESKHWRCEFMTMQKAVQELSKRLQQDSEKEAEFAVLKLELQKYKSSLGEMEAAHARTLSAQAGMFLAVQQLAQELENAKKAPVGSELESKKNESQKQEKEGKEEEKQELEKEDRSSTTITLSMETYLLLIEKAKKADEITVKKIEKEDSEYAVIKMGGDFESLRGELDIADERIGELQLGLEKALRRVVIAERGRLAAEEEISKLRDRKQGGRSDLSGESEIVRRSRSLVYDKKVASNYLTLGKLLHMKY